ncbi:DUF1285 domain-containing protein [Hansschlegelia sp. KR7-227]|uniref:DUF1285 domain-containing protein n=1 Tax=Hansschlegelia sp. KR7-227 TaxID=3400914 RepID=UPI003C05191A
MSDEADTGPAAEPAGNRMSALAAAASEACARGPAPVHLWKPERCGALDLVIKADGTWLYEGTPIGRPALVKLFSTVLRRDREGYVLVTPAEKLSITVEDAPFVAVEMASEGDGAERSLRFRTNVDEVVDVGPEHPLRFEEDAAGGFRPYLHVRSDLWALVARSAVYDLVDLGEERRPGVFGVWAGGVFFPMGEAAAWRS